MFVKSKSYLYIFFCSVLIVCQVITGCSLKQIGKPEAPVIWTSTTIMPRFGTLMFHEISEEGINAVSKEKFESIIKNLSDSNYHFLSDKEVYDFLMGQKDIPENSVWITFDDGFLSSHQIGTKILKKYKAKATAFIEVSRIGKPLRLSDKDLKNMVKSGVWGLQSHGYNGHNSYLKDRNMTISNFYFNKLMIDKTLETTYAFKKRINNDLQKSFDYLETNFGSKKYFFAYPIGGSDYEKSKIIKTVNSVLDKLNILGIGVSGSDNPYTDRSNPKHSYTRLGITNNMDIKYILSFLNSGTRIYVSDKNKKYVLTHIVKYIDNRYFAWDYEGNFAVLNSNMKPISGLSKILSSGNHKPLVLNGKTSVAVNPNGSIWLANWDERKLYKVDKSLIVEKAFALNINPAGIWIYQNSKLFLLDAKGYIYSFDGKSEKMEFAPRYNIGCSGGCPSDNIVYVGDRIFKKIYKIDYINKKIISSKGYNATYTITPHITIDNDEFIASEATNHALIKVKY